MSFYNDNFIDAPGTSLINHTSNSGATYTPHPFYPSGSAVEVVTGTRVRGNAVTPNIFNISQAAPNSDHSMTCKVYIASTGQTEDIGVLCRVTKTNPGNWYSLTIRNGVVHLFKNVNNTYTQLGSDITLGEVAGIGYYLTLACLAGIITATVQRDSDNKYLTSSGTWQVAPVSVFSVTDGTVPLANNVGLWIGNQADGENTGYQMISASGTPVVGLTPLQVLDVKAGFGAQGLVRGSVTDGQISGNTLMCNTTQQFIASDVGKDICVVSGNAMAPVFNAARNGDGTAMLPPPAPTLGVCCTGSLPTTKYYVVIDWQSYTGEGSPSVENTTAFNVNAGNVLVVSHPTSPPPLAVGWNVYVAAQLQAPTGITFTNALSTGGYLQAATRIITR